MSSPAKVRKRHDLAGITPGEKELQLTQSSSSKLPWFRICGFDSKVGLIPVTHPRRDREFVGAFSSMVQSRVIQRF